jgi:hypothetical protein
VPVGAVDAADERRDFDGDGYVSADEWYESYRNAYEDFMDDPYMYSSPRHIDVGISVSW